MDRKHHDGPARGEARSTDVEELMKLLTDRAPTHDLDEWTRHWALRAGCEGPAEHQTVRVILEIRDVLIGQQRTQERYRAL